MTATFLKLAQAGGGACYVNTQSIVCIDLPPPDWAGEDAWHPPHGTIWLSAPVGVDQSIQSLAIYPQLDPDGGEALRAAIEALVVSTRA